MNLLKEKNDIWQNLKNEARPIVLYGMGNGADKILSACEMHGIKISDVFASDEFVRGHFYKGFTVKKYSQICELYSEFVILVAFATSIHEVMERIIGFSEKHTLYIPDVPVYGGGFFDMDFYKENERNLQAAYDLLSDEASKRLFSDALNYKISGKSEYLIGNSMQNAEILKLLDLNDNEAYVDIGAYTGDTVNEFIDHTGGKYEKIIAFEPDKRNFKKLGQNTINARNLQTFNLGTSDKCETVLFSQNGNRGSTATNNKGAETPLVAIDEALNTERITYVKIDSEGYEMKTLYGMQNIIKAQRPKLNVALYHRNEDMFALPLYIHSLNPDYKFFIRRVPYFPLWDMNLYCI